MNESHKFFNFLHLTFKNIFMEHMGFDEVVTKLTNQKQYSDVVSKNENNVSNQLHFPKRITG